MILDALGQITDSPLHGLVTMASFVFALVAAISFHEFSHALSATLLGDPTPRNQRRLSLNPLRHLDPLGSAMILLAGFGWGKPVIINPDNLSPSPRAGMGLTALAGPLSNLIFAFLASLPLNLGLVQVRVIGLVPFRGDQSEIVGYALGALIFLNLVLAAFNLIPIAPLDGFKVVLGALPRDAAIPFARLEPIGPGILLLLIMLSYVAPAVGVLSTIISPVLNVLAALVLPGYV